MMSTLNNTNNIDNKVQFSTFDNVFDDSIKRQNREVELDYLTGNGAPPNNVDGNIRNVERKAQVKQSTNNMVSNSNIISSNNKGSRTARYHALKDAKQLQLLQLDEQQTATSSKQLPEDTTTQTRDETVNNKSSKVIRKQLFKPEVIDDIGNTIQLESAADDIEVDENTNLILQQSTNIIESAANVETEEIANIDSVEIDAANVEAEDIKSRENGPRPRRNPKGIRWNGWFDVDNNRGSGSGRDGSNDRDRGVSRWIESGKLDVDHDGIDDHDELGDYEIEGSIRDIDELVVEEEREKEERMLPRNVGDNAW